MEVWLAVATAAAAAGWFIVLGLLALATRPDLPAAAAKSMTVGRETPAVAGFLVGRWRVPRSATTATLLDLATGGHLGIDDLGDGTVVRLRRRQVSGTLRPYEQQVLDLVRDKAAGDVVPVPALSPGDDAASLRWWRQFEKEVVADATAAGLARPRWTAGQLAALTGLAGIPAVLAGALVLALGGSGDGDGDWTFPIAAAAAVWIALVAVVRWVRASRDTPAGRDAAAGWLGLRDYLAEDETFPDLPPSAVLVWERYLGYAAAFGVARTALRMLPMGAESPYRAWSAFGGTWREVRIRYPTAFGWGRHPLRIALVGAALTAVGGFVARKLFPLLADLPGDIRLDGSLDVSSDTVALSVVGVLVAVAAAVLAAISTGLVLLSRALPDLVTRREVIGVVLRRRFGDENTPTFVAVDDGGSDRIRAWVVPSRHSAPAPGQQVRAVISPQLGRIFRLELLRSGAPGPAGPSTPGTHPGSTVELPAGSGS